MNATLESTYWHPSSSNLIYIKYVLIFTLYKVMPCPCYLFMTSISIVIISIPKSMHPLCGVYGFSKFGFSKFTQSSLTSKILLTTLIFYVVSQRDYKCQNSEIHFQPYRKKCSLSSFSFCFLLQSFEEGSNNMHMNRCILGSDQIKYEAVL